MNQLIEYWMEKTALSSKLFQRLKSKGLLNEFVDRGAELMPSSFDYKQALKNSGVDTGTYGKYVSPENIVKEVGEHKGKKVLREILKSEHDKPRNREHLKEIFEEAREDLASGQHSFRRAAGDPNELLDVTSFASLGSLKAIEKSKNPLSPLDHPVTNVGRAQRKGLYGTSNLSPDNENLLKQYKSRFSSKGGGLTGTGPGKMTFQIPRRYVYFNDVETVVPRHHFRKAINIKVSPVE